MRNDISLRTRLREWIDGERPPKLEHALHEPRVRTQREHIVLDEEALTRQLLNFLRRFHVAATVLCAVLFAVLVYTVLTLPPYGAADNPTNNAVSAEYLTRAAAETGEENAVSAMIFSYRGFDTLGESCVLFLALCCVLMLLEQSGASRSLADRFTLRREETAEARHSDLIFSHMSALLAPCIALYGFYVLLGGESTPGGGFSAGAVLSAALILISEANGRQAAQKLMPRRRFLLLRTAGLLLYWLLFALFILTRGELVPAGSIMLPIDLAVALVVMSTMYGFYALFSHGEI